MKNVYSIKKLYDPHFPVMFFTSNKKAVESAKTSLLLLGNIEKPSYAFLAVGAMMLYLSVKIDGVEYYIIIEQHLVH